MPRAHVVGAVAALLVLSVDSRGLLALEPPPEGAEVIAAGVPLSGEVAPGAAQAYTFEVEQGQLIEALLEQEDVDLALEVRNPGQEVELVTDLEELPLKSERIVWVASAPGPHTLVVRSKSAHVKGHYHLRLEPPRPPTEADRKRAEAARAFAEVHPLEERLAAMPQALARLQELRTVFHAAGDVRGEADALAHMAQLHGYLNQLPRALETARQVLELRRATGDRAGEVWAYYQIGRAHRALAETSPAADAFEQAIRLAREQGNTWTEASNLAALGELWRRAGDPERAIETLERAARLARDSGNLVDEGIAENSLGVTYKELGAGPEALQAYERTAAAFRALGKTDEAARVYNNIGSVHRMMGDDHRAIDFYRRYLDVALENQDQDDEARARNNLATSYYRLGDYETALENSQRSLALRMDLGDLPGQAAARHRIGQILHKLGRSEEALPFLREGLRLHRELREEFSEAETLQSLALVERDRGNLKEALDGLVASVTLAETLRSRLTHPELRASFISSGQDCYELLIDVLMRLHEREPDRGHDGAALEASERGRARGLLESLVEARVDVREGVDPELLEQERALQKQLREASEAFARRRGRSTSDVAAATKELEEASHRLDELQAGIRRTSPRYTALTQPSALNASEIQRRVLDEGTVLLEYALGEERSWLWAVTPGTLSAFRLARRSEIEAAARHFCSLVTRPPGATARGRGRDREERAAAMALGRLLLEPLASRLGGEWRNKRLLIVTSGPLAYVPFAALPEPPSPDAPLLRNHEIVSLPSASILPELRERGVSRQEATIAVLADPVFDQDDPRLGATARKGSKGEGATLADGAAPAAGSPLTRAALDLGRTGFPRLPFSREEANAISALAPRGSVLKATDFDARRALLTEGGLAGRRIVHLATHGLLDGAHPELSGLVLSLVDNKGGPQDGFLRMRDVYNLRLDADLVVLSGCQTALGREIRGEGLIGLTRGFMYAGAPRVIASLWQVDDQSTAELMKRFYAALLRDGQTPAQALRSAQSSMAAIRRWASPYYWAGFILQGDWK
jgi:CHAT domain-containing protein/Tfp pilus assembly protein PilF